MIFVLWSFLSKQNKEEDNNLLESFIFSSLLLYMEEKWTHFEELSESDIRKLISNNAPESTKETTKFTVNTKYKS